MEIARQIAWHRGGMFSGIASSEGHVSARNQREVSRWATSYSVLRVSVMRYLPCSTRERFVAREG